MAKSSIILPFTQNFRSYFTGSQNTLVGKIRALHLSHTSQSHEQRFVILLLALWGFYHLMGESVFCLSLGGGTLSLGGAGGLAFKMTLTWWG